MDRKKEKDSPEKGKSRNLELAELGDGAGGGGSGARPPPGVAPGPGTGKRDRSRRLGGSGSGPAAGEGFHYTPFQTSPALNKTTRGLPRAVWCCNDCARKTHLELIPCRLPRVSVPVLCNKLLWPHCKPVPPQILLFFWSYAYLPHWNESCFGAWPCLTRWRTLCCSLRAHTHMVFLQCEISSAFSNSPVWSRPLYNLQTAGKKQIWINFNLWTSREQ